MPLPIKKVLSPIFYFLPAPLLFLGIMTLFALLERSGLTPYNGFIHIPVSIFIFGILLFWPLTRWLLKFEKNKSPDGIDHLRQSILYYIYFAFLLTRIAGGAPLTSLSGAYLILASGISLWAIIVNGTTMFKQLPTNKAQ